MKFRTLSRNRKLTSQIAILAILAQKVISMKPLSRLELTSQARNLRLHKILVKITTVAKLEPTVKTEKSIISNSPNPTLQQKVSSEIKPTDLMKAHSEK